MNSGKTDPTHKIETENGIIQRTEEVKYLGEILTPTTIERKGWGGRARKMEMAFKLRYGTYKNKTRSIPFQTETLLHSSQTGMPLHYGNTSQNRVSVKDAFTKGWTTRPKNSSGRRQLLIVTYIGIRTSILITRRL